MTYEVLSCDIPMQGTVSRILACGEVTLPALSPGETGKARFSLPASFAEGDVLKLEAFDRDGHRICDWSFPIRLANPYFSVIWHRFPQACPAMLFRHVTMEKKLY